MFRSSTCWGSLSHALCRGSDLQWAVLSSPDASRGSGQNGCTVGGGGAHALMFCGLMAGGLAGGGGTSGAAGQLPPSQSGVSGGPGQLTQPGHAGVLRAAHLDLINDGGSAHVSDARTVSAYLLHRRAQTQRLDQPVPNGVPLLLQAVCDCPCPAPPAIASRLLERLLQLFC